MDAAIDIRDQDYLSGDDLKTLNFIKESGLYTFRKHYRSGLRSHIFEVLWSKDVEMETLGKEVNGIRVFPRAQPVKMFRIFRQRFLDTESIFREIKKYNLLLKWLGPRFIAKSQEFITDYIYSGKNQILLCGLQEYVDGEILDPWRLFNADCLKDLLRNKIEDDQHLDRVAIETKNNIQSFIKRIRGMINQTGFIPDLAGNGNLIVTRDGQVKLVDINNIVRIDADDIIRIDDKGYPSCDVSIQVLSILEQVVLGRKIGLDDPFYGIFLSEKRKQTVKSLERKFYKNLNAISK